MKNIRRFKLFLKPKSALYWGFVTGIIGSLASVTTTYFLGKAVDLLIGQGAVNFSALKIILWRLALLIICTSLTQYLTQYFANKMAYESVHALRTKAITHLDLLPVKFFDTHSHGDLVSRFTNDMDNISVAITAIFTQLFQGVAMIVLGLIFMLSLSPALTLTLLATTPLIFLVNFLVAKHSQKTFFAQQEMLGQLASIADEGITGQKIIKAFQQENVRQNLFDTTNQKLYQTGQQAQFASSLTNPAARFVDHLAYVAIAFVAAWFYFQHPNAMSIGILSSFTIYAGQFSKPIIELSGLMTQLQTAKVGLDRSFMILDATPEIVTSTAHFPEIIGQIEFSHVDFSYEKNQTLITDLNLKVQPGQKVAIVGKTGAGKSTLINLLLRFYEVDAGQILIDNQPITEFSRTSLREYFGLVLQETWLMNASIADNLRFGNPEATQDQLEDACRQARIDHFIKTLPNGYQTILGKDFSISNGQRQLLTIARTILKNPPLLILDEATSNVDTLTEKQIQKSFNTMMEGKTSFVIAHRLATIQNADLIVVMDAGTIVESGTHQELLTKKGVYYQLYHAQFA
ncbi:ABC transporter ATP-binding protein [Enterococcus timonensis]|uniref:ABC transporter ATP-binding protein n=1 Tax=Enterococcus timonensis TaxID=1852364 RepID=UPI0008DB1468|nr:ABC transporter ATP-binding protein [Enterococcus timonensis]